MLLLIIWQRPPSSLLSFVAAKSDGNANAVPAVQPLLGRDDAVAMVTPGAPQALLLFCDVEAEGSGVNAHLSL